MRVCVTGASGFVGGHLVAYVHAVGHEVVAVSRSGAAVPGAPRACRADLATAEGWAEALDGCDALLHLAARAHVLSEREADPLAAFRRTNVEGSLRVAEFARNAGVRRFVFVSSIGVNGNGASRPYTERDSPAPVEPYAVSKLEAETALRAYCAQAGMELVIVRPVLVYGPGNPGNFLRLLRLASIGLPLPLEAVRSLRSFIGVRNLVSLLERCLWHDGAVGRTLLAADGADIALPDVLRLLAAGMGRPLRLVAIPPPLLQLAGSLIGRRATVDRLIGALRVDCTATFDALEWSPPVGIAEGMLETGRWFVGSSGVRSQVGGEE